MFILSYEFLSNEVDEKVELLQINDIFDVFYENPLEITTDEFGYGYLEKENVPLTLKVAFNDEESKLDNFKTNVSSILKKEPFNIEEINYDYTDFKMPPIELKNDWVLIDPSYNDDYKDKKIINFISQGAFGTGLHETTHDILNYILEEDFTNKRVLDIGTGSGILSLATGIKNAKEVLALDIRDVSDEVTLNRDLNNLNNITPIIGDALSENLISSTFDCIYINIGGEETKLFMNFIKEHLSSDGLLLVSGLVTWSYDSIKDFILNEGFIFEKEFITNEWCTCIFKRKN
ncbi:MAG: 50S ribosomal protein L11 methyltransferase [Clostridium sp.]|uniref:50S ribosomal protein L11 methyltransferase n=1 Tax=Clostridium sp. TaxID=1506 RepID=UPI003EE43B6A